MSIPELIMRHAIEWVREAGSVPSAMVLPPDIYARLLREVPTKWHDGQQGYVGVHFYTLGGLIKVTCDDFKGQERHPKQCAYCGSHWPDQDMNCRNCGAGRGRI